MRTAEHLTIEQLRAYAADTVEPPARREIGAHLIGCPDCRARLPKPSTEQFLAALFTENRIGENDAIVPSAQANSRRLEKRSIFNVGESLFPAKILASAGAFVLLAAFLLFGWWLTATKNSGGETANSAALQLPAKVAENKNAAPEQTPLVAQTDDGDRNAQEPTNKNSIAKTVEDFAVKPQKQRTGGDAKVSPQSNLIARQSRDTETESESATEREIAALLEETPPSVASLKSNGAAVLRSSDQQQQPEAGKRAFVLTFPVGETVLEAQPEFRWQAVPTAKSYQISILDSSYDEVASSTVTKPVFMLNKPLARGAIYLWRVTAKIDTGSEIVAPLPPLPPARFRVAADETEKQIAESQKRADGKLARAALLAREGMLDSAAHLLREILRENPRHKSARRLLNRVEEWQRTAR